MSKTNAENLINLSSKLDSDNEFDEPISFFLLDEKRHGEFNNL